MQETGDRKPTQDEINELEIASILPKLAHAAEELNADPLNPEKQQRYDELLGATQPFGGIEGKSEPLP